MKGKAMHLYANFVAIDFSNLPCIWLPPLCTSEEQG